MAKMRAVQVARPGSPLELIEREVSEPAQGEVRVGVEACCVPRRHSHRRGAVARPLVPPAFTRLPA
jgi:D-arabinose 1-dehydrogenase-like Zn-dependent alcohol dehydrogenase